MDKERLLERLDNIGKSLERNGHALALLGLGSVGRELDRLDKYSDLDFFVIVDDGQKQAFLRDLTWLSSVAPVAYCFKNTADGYKLLFSDGIFCEFAVFESAELSSIPFSPGRIVWKRAEVPDSISVPTRPAQSVSRDMEWLLGEALTNLYVGMSRERRGEKLSATRFIQGFAMERVSELAALMNASGGEKGADPFSPDRRFEQRYPRLAEKLPGCLRGYEGNAESALAILALLEECFSVDKDMAQAIRSLCSAR